MDPFYSRAVYPSVSGAAAAFGVPFPFLDREHVHVYVTAPRVEQVKVVEGVDYDFSSDSLIIFRTGRLPVAGSTVEVGRQTPSGPLQARLARTGTISSTLLNLNQVQLLYLTQEAADTASLLARRGILAASGEEGLLLGPQAGAAFTRLLGLSQADGSPTVLNGEDFRGPPGDSVEAVGLFRTLTGVVLKDSVVKVRTSGHTNIGYGIADYALTTNTGATPYRFQAQDGRWFELVAQFPDTYMFGGIGDGVADDYAAFVSQQSYCIPRVLPLLIPPAKVRWRHTQEIQTRVIGIAGIGCGTVELHFDPPSPEAVDMQAGIRNMDDRLFNGGIIENLALRGPHAYFLNLPETYINDAAYGPHRVGDADWAPLGVGGPAGGWYNHWLKKGTAGLFVGGDNQPLIRNVKIVPGTHKVGVALDTSAGHVRMGKGCSFPALISVRILRNTDDYQFGDEVMLNGILVGLLFGTFTSNGHNGGAGIRSLHAYISSAYGILQLNDHGNYGTPYGDGRTMCEGIYGDLAGAFFEFTGLHALRTLPNATCSNLLLKDISRFSYDQNKCPPESVVAASVRGEAAFYMGQVSNNVKIGTDTCRGNLEYVCPYSTNPQRTGLYIDQFTGDTTTELSSNLRRQTRIRDSRANLLERAGRKLHEGDLLLSTQVLSAPNLLSDPYDVNRWENAPSTAPVVLTSGAGSLAGVPWEMAEELGGSDPLILRMDPGQHLIRMVDALANNTRNRPQYQSMWGIVPPSASMRIQQVARDGNDADFDTFISDNTLPPEAFVSQRVNPVTGVLEDVREWQRVELPPFQSNGRFKYLRLIIAGGPVYIGGLMATYGKPAPFNRTGGAVVAGGLTIRGNVEFNGGLFLNGQTGGAPTNLTTPDRWRQVSVDGAVCYVPFYR